jgi:hypothetical protein
MALRDLIAPGVAQPPVVLDWSLAFESRAPKLALAYWRSRCGDRPLPLREDLNPSGMAAFLPNVALIEVQSAADANKYRIRVAGLGVESVFGHVGGKFISDSLPPEIEARWKSYFDAVVKACKPLRLTGRVSFEDKTWLIGEALLAPLGMPDKPVQMIFAAFSSWPADPSD